MEKNIEAKNKRCPHCLEYIYADASVCSVCREHIGWKWLFKPRISGPFFYYLIAALSVCYAFHEKNIAQENQVHAIDQKNAIVSDVNKANLTLTNKNISTDNLTISAEESFKNSILLKVTGEIQKALTVAFSLKDQRGSEFVWGGKSPEEGFDSSGFVSYILFRINVLDAMDYREFSSEVLKNSFLGIDAKDAQIGDLIIHKSGLSLFYLGEKKGIGIGNSNGIKIFDVDLTKDWAVRRWEGLQVLSVTNEKGRRITDESGKGLFAVQ